MPTRIFCPSSPTNQNRPHYGIFSTLCFSSDFDEIWYRGQYWVENKIEWVWNAYSVADYYSFQIFVRNLNRQSEFINFNFRTWHLKWPQIILTAPFMFHGQFVTRNCRNEGSMNLVVMLGGRGGNNPFSTSFIPLYHVLRHHPLPLFPAHSVIFKRPSRTVRIAKELCLGTKERMLTRFPVPGEDGPRQSNPSMKYHHHTKTITASRNLSR